MFKNITAAQAIDRACRIINFATRPACNASFWDTTLIRDTKSNQLTVNFSYVENYENLCRTNLAAAQAPPPALVNYAPSMTIASQSPVGQAMIGLSVAGIIVQVVLMVLVILKRKARVIRAAAFVPSVIILFGELMRIEVIPA
ncbi:hypothetical protein HDV00_004547 [Rhizophlyctis rosea]|nr:hypothetical protein HDV00_004547 [Rhizophlyctis rosea]